MNIRFVALTGLLAIGCGTAAPPPTAAPTPASTAVTTTAEPQTPFVYYQMVQAGHVELIVDEVRLDTEASRCFQARRRLLGGFDFDQGADTLPADASAAEVQAVVQSFQDWKQQGKTPTLVLHGHASSDEAESEDAARSLSEKRADAVKTRLVAKGAARRPPSDRCPWLVPVTIASANRRKPEAESTGRDLSGCHPSFRGQKCRDRAAGVFEPDRPPSANPAARRRVFASHHVPACPPRDIRRARRRGYTRAFLRHCLCRSRSCRVAPLLPARTLERVQLWWRWRAIGRLSFGASRSEPTELNRTASCCTAHIGVR